MSTYEDKNIKFECPNCKKILPLLQLFELEHNTPLGDPSDPSYRKYRNYFKCPYCKPTDPMFSSFKTIIIKNNNKKE